MAQAPPKSKKQSKPAVSTATSAAAKKISRKLADEPSIFPETYQDALALALIALVLAICFWPALFGGKVFIVPDLTASLSTRTFLNDANEKGFFPLWTPYLFGGMPSYGSLSATGDRWFDVLYNVWQRGFVRLGTILSPNGDVNWVVFYYFLMGAGTYFLLRFKNFTAVQALAGALGMTFATQSLVWIMVGHNTKIMSIAAMPFIFLFIERIRLQRSDDWKPLLFNTAMLAFVLHVQLQSSHIQMIFYSCFAVGIYLLVELVHALFVKPVDATATTTATAMAIEPAAETGEAGGEVKSATPLSSLSFSGVKGAVRGGIAFVLALLIGAAMSADMYLSVWEYNPYSTRSTVSITEKMPEFDAAGDGEPDAKKSGKADYAYATNWSFDPAETLTFFFPSYFGYGDDAYWGPQPFTSSPEFFGTTILILAFTGLIAYRRDPFVQAMVIIGTLALLISFGKYFSPFYDVMFNFFPYFDRFRAPKMILILTQFAACILAAYGVRAIFDLRFAAKPTVSATQGKTVLQYAAIGAAALFLLTVVGISGCKDGYVKSLAESDKGKQIVAQYGGNVEVIKQFNDQLGIFETMKSDAMLSLAIAALLLGGIYLFATQKMPRMLFETGLVVLILFDLLRVSTKPLVMLQEKQAQTDFFAATDYTDFLTKDKSKFRIVPLAREAAKPANWYAYFRLETVSGYHPAKLRVIQDLVDVAGNGAAENFVQSPALLDLFNVKYLIVDKPMDLQGYRQAFSGSKVILQREDAAPRAWFVKTLETKKDVDILRSLKGSGFNPRDTAYLETLSLPKVDAVDSSASVEVTGYGIHEITLATAASGNHFLFLSEIYYPKGWRAFVDGTETEIYKTNYAFRGVVVPKGKHQVKFVFDPQSFTTGRTLTMFSNGLIGLPLLFFSGDWLRRKFSKPKEPAPPSL